MKILANCNKFNCEEKFDLLHASIGLELKLNRETLSVPEANKERSCAGNHSSLPRKNPLCIWMRMNDNCRFEKGNC